MGIIRVVDRAWTLFNKVLHNIKKEHKDTLVLLPYQ